MSIETKYNTFDVGISQYTPSVAEGLSGAAVTPQYSHFVIVLVNPTTINVQPNQQFSVNVTVKNDGSAQGTALVKLLDQNGNVVDQKSVTLNAGEESTVTLNAIAPSNSGTYTYMVQLYNEDTNKVDDSATITVNVSAPTPPPTSTTKPAKSYWWIIILILIILGAIAYILSKK